VTTRPAFDTVLFDVDGTLIDSNAAHAEAWARALAAHGKSVDVEQVRRAVGMGGDKLLPAVAGVREDSPLGQELVRTKKAIFTTLLPHLRPTAGARRLLQHLSAQHIRLVVATSADDRELNALLDRAGVTDLFPQRTSKDDAPDSKPDPDIVRAAIAKAHANASRAVMVGDTPYDIRAARRAGIPAIALRCGGYWREQDLAGAIAILDDPDELRRTWENLQRDSSGTDDASNGSIDEEWQMTNKISSSVELASERVSDAARGLSSSAADAIDRTRTSTAKGLDAAAAALRENMDELPGGDRVGRLAKGAADRLEGTARYVRRHNVNGMVTDLTRIVKNNPGPALLIAAAAGFIAGRALTRD
jgi:HAD superfamily hydrolase (TIGR01509 family)